MHDIDIDNMFKLIKHFQFSTRQTCTTSFYWGPQCQEREDVEDCSMMLRWRIFDDGDDVDDDDDK